MNAIGTVLLALGAIVTLANVYTSWLRPLLHLGRGGTRETYRWVSGMPLIGSAMLWISIPLLSSTSSRWLAGGLSLIDTGGIHWFLYSLWKRGALRDFLRMPFRSR